MIVGNPTDQEPGGDIPGGDDPTRPGQDADVVPHTTVPDTGSYIKQSVNDRSDIFLPWAIGVVIVVVLAVVFLVSKKKAHRVGFGDRDLSRGKIILVTGSISLLLLTLIFVVVQNGLGAKVAFGTGNEPLEISVSENVEIKIKSDGGDAFAVGHDMVEVVTPTRYGYTLYAYSSSRNLVTEKEGSGLIKGIEFSDDTSLLEDNSWGIATVVPSDSMSQVWWAVPDSTMEPLVIKTTSSANDKTTQVYYGVKISADLPEGIYSGNVNYIAYANPGPDDPIDPVGPDDPSGGGDEEPEEPVEDDSVTYTLSFNANNGAGAPTRQSCGTVLGSSCVVTIPSKVPSRSGYAFLGWAESVSSTSVKYHLGDNVTLSSDITLYAVWERRINIYTSVASGGGTISDSMTNVPTGTSRTISFTANDGYELEYVTVDRERVTVTNNTITVVAGSDDIYVVVFYKKQVEPTPSVNSLSFSANSGSGVPNDVSCTPATVGGSCQVTIPDKTPTRKNYYFLGWADAAGATSATKQKGDKVTLTSNMTLYAIWSPLYYLNLDYNDGTMVAAIANCHPASTQGTCTITIPSLTPQAEEKAFKGWSETSNGAVSYQSGGKIVVSTSITLYAVWQSETIAVHFINLGASGNATLLENKGKYAIVDTGQTTSYARVKNYLDSLGVTRLEFIIVSHPHVDHNGGVVNLLNDYEVGAIYEKTYTNKDTNANGNELVRYNRIVAKAESKNVPIIYVDEDSRFKEAPGKSGSVYLNNTMRIHFFNTVQRIDHVKQSGETFDYFTSNYWETKGENLNSLVNLIRVNGHNVLLTGDANYYDILDYIMKNKVDVAYKNGQTLDVYSIPHHANYNCTGNKPMSIQASYYLATNDVNSKFDNGEYRITNNTVIYPGGNVYSSCFKQMGLNYKSAYYSVNDKSDSPATVFNLTGSEIKMTGGYKGSKLTDGHN